MLLALLVLLAGLLAVVAYLSAGILIPLNAALVVSELALIRGTTRHTVFRSIP